MALVLEVRGGFLDGRKFSVPVGSAYFIGRVPDHTQFAVPHDNLMSGVHFCVECALDGCRVIDKKSTNGTYLNGAKIREPMLLANGDEIKSGHTTFVVRMVSDNPLSGHSSNQRDAAQGRGALARPAPVPADPPSRATAPSAPQAPPPHPAQSPALAIGSWVFHKVPEGWKILEGLGIQQDLKDAFPASIGVAEGPLGSGATLSQFIAAQSKMFRESLSDSRIETVPAPLISGSEESAALVIHFTIKDGPSVCFHRVYARKGPAIGVLTLTVLEADLSAIRPTYDSVLSSVAFFGKE